VHAERGDLLGQGLGDARSRRVENTASPTVGLVGVPSLLL
jgi:hypothetical protein